MQFKVEYTNDHHSFIHRYLQQDEKVTSYYDYNLSSTDSLARYDELMTKLYNREGLVNALTSYNQQYNPSEGALIQIERLRDPSSVVVIGGQQAGLLSGPIYTINKIISILIEAKSLEESLTAPVIPIFWIAGEDHDIDEVNHTFFYDGQAGKKIRIPERNDIKQPMSNRQIDIVEAKRVIEEAFRFLPETQHLKGLLDELLNDLSDKMTYTEWCAKVLYRLFRNTDLVLMDAADPAIRQIEQPFFEHMIERNKDMQINFLEQANKMKKDGLGEPITIDEYNSHLFFHEDGQRYLLERTEAGYKEKQGIRSWSEEELLNEVKAGKVTLSNNVVSRPVMQDLLLPVHTFIAGPGELKYWGVLKKVFHCFDHSMPLVKPRYHLTYISRTTEKNLINYNLTAKRVSMSGVEDVKNRLIESEKAVDEQQVFARAMQSWNGLSDKIAEELSMLGTGMESINEYYRERIDRQMKEYKKTVERFVISKHEIHLRRLNQIEMEIKPDGHLQERYLNIYPFLNMYGKDLVERTVNKLFEKRKELTDGSHIYTYL